MEGKEISRAVVKRLPRYYRYLGDLLERGVERISSNDLSEKMRVTASQIRQDLNNFGGFGQQGYGYNVEFLYNEIGRMPVAVYLFRRPVPYDRSQNPYRGPSTGAPQRFAA